MRLSRTIFLLSSSCLLILQACVPAFKKMSPASGNSSQLNRFRPKFNRVLYRTTVDVVGNHLGGILLVKAMPDSSTRMVFSNEMGYTFFDFGFGPTGDFTVFSITEKMNKKAVITTLRKDFELVLMKWAGKEPAETRQAGNLVYYIFPQSKGYNYYITDSSRSQLIRMERASKRKTVVTAVMQDYRHGIPDTIGISHRSFQFNIGLKRIVE